ncbi:MAG: hypothetical protein R3183_01820 [Oleiphilaceae bacterium]|nr:hypothetical protein [Oleiphilaceae bacterium]
MFVPYRARLVAFLNSLRCVVKVFVGSLLALTLAVGSSGAMANEDEFQPAYQNEGNYQIESPDKYFERHGERVYYTSGKKNGFRVNENNEESTDETIGILTFLIAPATIVYMNLVGWWE